MQPACEEFDQGQEHWGAPAWSTWPLSSGPQQDPYKTGRYMLCGSGPKLQAASFKRQAA